MTTTTASSLPLFGGTRFAGLRSRRWELPADPNVFACSDELPLHLQVARTADIGQPLLRASKRIHQALRNAGMAMGNPLRRIESTVNGSTLTDAFLLGLEEDRLQGALFLDLTMHGELSVTLMLESLPDPDRFGVRATRLFERSQRLGQLDWTPAAISTDRYCKRTIIGLLRTLEYDERVLDPQWTQALVDHLVL